ncbi:hypothetical protein GCM10028821_11020 [Hymenobacter jeollabukensis]
MVVSGSCRGWGATMGDAFVLKMNTQADTAWVRTFQTTGTDSFLGPTLSTDGNYFVYGWINFQNRVLKVSPTGAVLWNVASNHSSAFLGNNTALLAVGGGGCWVFSNGPDAQQQRLETRVHALTGAAGTETAQWLLPRFQYPVTHVATLNNEIVVSGSQEMAKLTPQGDTVWTRRFARSRPGWAWVARAVQPDALGDYAVLAEAGGGSPYSYQFQLLRIDSQRGQVRNDTLLLRPTGNTYPKSLLLAPNGDYFISGYTPVGPSGGPDLIAAQFRRFKPLPTRAAQRLAEVLQVYPNPAGGAAVQVRLPDGLGRGANLVIIDARGQTARRQAVPAGQQLLVLPVAALSAGLYVVRLQAADGRVWGGRLVRE